MYIVADIGGTKTRIAGGRGLEKFDEPVILETPQEYEEALARISGTMQQVSGTEPIERIIAGKPSSKNLPKWKGKDFAGDLEKILHVPVHLENDTALVGLGEAVFGAGKGAGIVVYITVSTGVNGARIVDGAIERSKEGFEIGGQYLSMEPMQTLEELVSGSAIFATFGKHPKELGKDSPIWEELARKLAFGVHNTILHWSPERVVLGGSMFNEIGIPVERVSAHVADIMKKFSELPEIVHSQLGDVGGLYGGLARLKQLG
jgi:predicted NBD/HSP70 family sugar kinase